VAAEENLIGSASAVTDFKLQLAKEKMVGDVRFVQTKGFLQALMM
jgi:hypothetical protein